MINVIIAVVWPCFGFRGYGLLRVTSDRVSRLYLKVLYLGTWALGMHGPAWEVDQSLLTQGWNVTCFTVHPHVFPPSLQAFLRPPCCLGGEGEPL